MCCVRNPRNINVFVRVPGREESGSRPGGSVTGVTEKLFMCQMFMCLSSGESNRPLTPIHVKKYRDTPPICMAYFCKCMPSPWQKVVYTPPICITIRLPFVSRYFCGSIRVRGRWDTPKPFPAPKHIATSFRGPRMGSWIRCGWIRRWGAPDFCSKSVENPFRLRVWGPLD